TGPHPSEAASHAIHVANARYRRLSHRTRSRDIMPEAPLIIRDGHAIPPREVEQILLGHPAVAEVAVIGVPDRFAVPDRFPGEIVAAAVRLSAPLPSAAADPTEYCPVL